MKKLIAATGLLVAGITFLTMEVRAVWAPQIRYVFQPTGIFCWDHAIHYPVGGGQPDYYTNSPANTYVFNEGDTLIIALGTGCCSPNATQVAWQWTQICYDPYDPPAQQVWYDNSPHVPVCMDDFTIVEQFQASNGQYKQEHDITVCPHQ